MTPRSYPTPLLAVDVGGTFTRAVVIDSTDRILALADARTPHGPEAIINSIVGIASSLKDRMRMQTAGIAVALSCALNPRSGVVVQGAKLGLPPGTDLGAAITAAAGVPALVRPELSMAAVGELVHGCGDRYSDFAVLTLGTGVGLGLILNSKPYLGADGLAGEIGHIPITDRTDARSCACGRTGCLEAYATRQGAGAAGAVAKSTLSNAAWYVAQALCVCINSYNPQAIVLRGGLARHIWPQIEAEVISRLQASALAPNTPILWSLLGDDGVFWGLAASWSQRVAVEMPP